MRNEVAKERVSIYPRGPPEFAENPSHSHVEVVGFRGPEVLGARRVPTDEENRDR